MVEFGRKRFYPKSIRTKQRGPFRLAETAAFGYLARASLPIYLRVRQYWRVRRRASSVLRDAQRPVHHSMKRLGMIPM